LPEKKKKLLNIFLLGVIFEKNSQSRKNARPMGDGKLVLLKSSGEGKKSANREGTKQFFKGEWGVYVRAQT